VLDNVERGGILEQPAREHLVPGELFLRRRALLDEELDEGPGFGRVFPRRGALASSELDDRIADAARFAGPELDHLGDIVALVEKAQRRDAVFDRGAEIAFHHPARSRSGRARTLRRLAWRRGFGRLLVTTGRKRQQSGRQHRGRQQQRCGGTHQPSGDQAS